MRTELHLFQMLGPKSIAKVENVLQTLGSLLLTVLRRCFWCNSYFMLIGVGLSFRISYSVVSWGRESTATDNS